MRLKLKRHFPLLILLILATLGLALGLGDQRIIAYTVPGRLQVAQAGNNVTNPVALFDETLVHSLQILISEAEYDQMITTYQETGVKDYFHADVIIDGVRVNDVGLRLKGNASLRTILGGGMRLPGGNQAPGAGGDFMPFDRQNPPDFGDLQMPPDGQLPNVQPPAGQLPGPENLPFRRGDGQAPGFQPGGIPSGQSGGDASKIPLLIKFDEFVSGQTYQGYTFLALRTGGTGSNAALLQEPLTNTAFRLAGLPAPRTSYAGVQLNTESGQLYVLSEIVDETYLGEYFANPDGVLYKAELGSDILAYRGADPSAYATSFSQETRLNDADLAPLIEFLRFINESDDAAFQRELPERLDIEAFASYLVVNNLLVNLDSMVAGMGNNFYLYYDDLAGKFTLLYWDGNESLGGFANGRNAGGTQASNYNIYYEGQRITRTGETSILMTRFLADPVFRDLYEQKLVAAYQQLFASGEILRQAEQYIALVRPAVLERSLADAAAYDSAVAQVQSFLQQRAAYLAATPLLAVQVTGSAAGPAE